MSAWTYNARYTKSVQGAPKVYKVHQIYTKDLIWIYPIIEALSELSNSTASWLFPFFKNSITKVFLPEMN